jgi:hypothetical protein
MWYISLTHYCIALFYLFLFSRLLWLSDINLSFGISKQRLLSIFLLKVFWCFSFIFFHIHWSGGTDTIDFFQQGEQVYRSIFRDPIDYLRLVFLPNHWYVSESLYHYNQAMSRYGDESTFLLIRLNAIFRLFSFGSYSAQAVMFSLVTLPGVLLMYRFFTNQLYLDGKTAIIILMVLPVTAFWIHGVHKEALLLSAIAVVLCAVSMNHHHLIRLLLLLIGLLVITIVRSHYLLFIVPLILSIWLFASNQKAMFICYLLFLAAVFGVVICYFNLNHISITDYIVSHRANYIALSSESISENSIGLHDVYAPVAVLLSPIDFFNVPDKISTWILLLFTLSGFGYMVYKSYSNTFKLNSLGLLLIITSLIEFLIIGLIVVQHGAIARYRAPVYCLMIAGILSQFIKKNKKNQPLTLNND